MIGLLVILFLFLWAAVSFKIGRTLGRKKTVRYQGLYGFLIFLIPFYEEMFVKASFSVHCKIYAGYTKSAKLHTNELFLENGSVRPLSLLQHPAIDFVSYSDAENLGQVYPFDSGRVFKTSSPKICNQPINAKWNADNLKNYRGLVALRAVNDGCYAFENVVGNMKYSYREESENDDFFSPLFPYPVKVLKYQVLSDGELEAEYTQLRARQGFLRQWVWPHGVNYSCPSSTGNQVTNDFPYGFAPLQFLQKVIRER